MNDLTFASTDDLDQAETTTSQEWQSLVTEVTSAWMPFAKVLRKFCSTFGKVSWHSGEYYSPIKVGDRQHTFRICTTSIYEDCTTYDIEYNKKKILRLTIDTPKLESAPFEVLIGYKDGHEIKKSMYEYNDAYGEQIQDLYIQMKHHLMEVSKTQLHSIDAARAAHQLSNLSFQESSMKINEALNILSTLDDALSSLMEMTKLQEMEYTDLARVIANKPDPVEAMNLANLGNLTDDGVKVAGPAAVRAMNDAMSATNIPQNTRVLILKKIQAFWAGVDPIKYGAKAYVRAQADATTPAVPSKKPSLPTLPNNAFELPASRPQPRSYGTARPFGDRVTQKDLGSLSAEDRRKLQAKLRPYATQEARKKGKKKA